MLARVCSRIARTSPLHLRAFSASKPPQFTYVIAVDGSDVSIDAVECAAKLMRADDRGVLLTIIEPIEVFFTPSIPPQQVKDMNEFKRKHVQDLQVEYEAYFANLNERLNWVVREGEPAEEISRCAFEHKADFLVLGDGGWSQIRKALMGSVVSTVVHKAPCSVIVVKQADRVRKEWARQHE